MRFEFLKYRPDAIGLVAQWYYSQWGHLNDQDSLQRTESRLREYLNDDKIPFMLLAVQRNVVMGAAQLKFREMGELFPDKEHWLGGVYVTPEFRGRGVGAQLVTEIVRLAPNFGVKILHLQTEKLDGGLYVRLGWKPITRTHHHGIEVQVMMRAVD